MILVFILGRLVQIRILCMACLLGLPPIIAFHHGNCMLKLPKLGPLTPELGGSLDEGETSNFPCEWSMIAYLTEFQVSCHEAFALSPQWQWKYFHLQHWEVVMTIHVPEE